MKRMLLAILSIIILVAPGLLAGCGIVVDGGGGNETTRTFNFSDFTRIKISDSFGFGITQSSTYSISVNATDAIMERVEISKSGDILQVELKGFILGLRGQPKVVITMPELLGVEASGASHGTSNGFQAGNDFTLKLSGASGLTANMKTGAFQADISGASTLKGDLTAASENIKLTGASNAQLTGSGGDLTLEASGASSARLSSFPVSNADVKFSGASHGEVNTNGKLDVTVSGASSLDYSGNPTLGRVDVSGASSLNRK